MILRSNTRIKVFTNKSSVQNAYFGIDDLLMITSLAEYFCNRINLVNFSYYDINQLIFYFNCCALVLVLFQLHMLYNFLLIYRVH